MLNFSKYIYLPSGGLCYPPDVWANKVTMEYKLFQVGNNSFDSFFELIVLLIKKYCKLPVDIGELLICDLYFLYMYIYISDIKQNDEYIINDACRSCGHMNIIKIHMSNIKMQYYNPYKDKIPKTYYYEYVFENQPVVIKYRMRNVIDNLHYSNIKFSMFSDTFDDYTAITILYLIPQIESITINQKEINKNQYYDFFINNNKKQIDIIYNKIDDVNNIIGFNRKIQYVCKKCNNVNYTNLYNDFFINEIYPQRSVSQKDKESLIRLF